MLAAGIPVMGHLVTYSSTIHRFEIYGMRATEQKEEQKLLEDAKLSLTGCFDLVLEKISTALAEQISHDLSIPTLVGIGVFR
ncbi:3-methyl-2-oxobutanoate hydroxymethyltransferase [Bacteroidetes bacterium endosymbiont of Geopemphigus sp.]|uniref:3-methyl-2-oxobutanoate hydroxymethyltransferase n=1 Tax=Bacteroidetes bacterium endosymbiont of Geopemphigus sp. TaxID=2047937 RepID=UPI0022438ECF|nr:3-methyl-2-oxobutanoate hydroxymethyltransferase [Bacteroidetes bacterium endosymbiont of Geopemphigus sp.]